MKPTKVFYDILKAYKDGLRTIVLKGSARSSKTVSLIQAWDFIANFSSKHRKLSIVSHSFPHLKDGAIYEYDKHQEREKISREHNKSDHEFKVNKSIINYFSLDTDGNKAIGPGRDLLWLNEPNRGITLQNYVDLKSRTTECVAIDYNPSGEFWLHTEKILDDPRTIMFTSTWLDNIENLSPAQIQDFIDAKKKSKTSPYWKYWWEVYGEGKDAVLLDERIMPMLHRAKEIPKDATEIPYGIDYGFFPDPTVMVRLFVKRGVLRDKLYIKQVVYGQRLHINSKSDGVANLTDLLTAKGINKRHLAIAESADPRSNSDLRAAGYTVEAVSKSSVETSIRLFHDYDIYIVDGSEETYKEFDSYRYKRNRKGIILGVPLEGQADHAIDATRYVLLNRNIRWTVK